MATENFGNVIIEALSCSTPVIASTNTPWESLAEKKCGAWIDNSPEAIAESLVEILSLDDSKYSELALNARSHVLQNYSIQSHQDEIERLIISAHTQSVLSDSNESEEAK